MKQLRKKKGMIGKIVGLCMLVFLVTGCGAQSLSDKFDEETVKTEAKKAVGYFNEHDYQGILDMSSTEFQEAITAEEFVTQCEPYHEKCGAYQEIEKTIVFGSSNKSAGQEYAGVIMVGRYADGTIQFTIGFDEEMKLVQFIIK